LGISFLSGLTKAQSLSARALSLESFRLRLSALDGGEKSGEICGENMARKYIHELVDWRKFIWNSKALAPLLSGVTGGNEVCDFQL
jgi:hypothetical protein